VSTTTTNEGLTHDEAMALQLAELERTLELLRGLQPLQWTARTDCPDWDVRQMYLHVLGACEGGASPFQQIHQMRAAKKRQKRSGGPLEANLSAVQVSEREVMDPAQLVERLTVVGPKCVKRRRKLIGWFRRHMKLKVDGPVFETWTLGYLIDTIYLRDMWMHRVDAARATGEDLVLTADHDGRILSDVVAEWARRHGQSYRLELTGPAGGSFEHGSGGESISMDAVEFARTLAGRASGTGLLTTVVPF